MKGRGEMDGLAADCEQKLAKLIDNKYSILENYLEQKKLASFEGEVKSARAGFNSSKGTSASALRAQKELDSIEAKFVKWYEGDEDVDDAQMFSSVISFIRETKEKLAIYSSAMACLQAGSKEECMERLEKAFGKFKAAADKACSLAKGGEERMVDNTDTMMRYIDLEHEARIVEMMAPSGSNDKAVERAISRMGTIHGSLTQLRADAYHAKNTALQRAAAELFSISYEYQGALCAAYIFAEIESG